MYFLDHEFQWPLEEISLSFMLMPEA
jgi:hypothetical protein